MISTFRACSLSSLIFSPLFQVLRLLDFLVSLLEHPLGKVIERLFFLLFPLFLFLIVIMTIWNYVVL
jgi:hypothetical protein